MNEIQMYVICLAAEPLQVDREHLNLQRDTYIYKGALNSTKGHITIQRNTYLYKGTPNSTKGHLTLKRDT